MSQLVEMSANWGLSVVVVVVAGAVAGHGDGGEAAGAGAEPGDASPVLRLLRGGEGDGGGESPPRPLAALHGADPHHALPPIRLAPPSLTAPPEAGGLVGDGGEDARRRLVVNAPLLLLVEAAPERPRVVGRRAHAGAAAHGRDADGRACSAAGELDARRGGGAVVRGGEDGPARPPRGRRRCRHGRSPESGGLGSSGDERRRGRFLCFRVGGFGKLSGNGFGGYL